MKKKTVEDIVSIAQKNNTTDMLLVDLDEMHNLDCTMFGSMDKIAEAIYAVIFDKTNVETSMKLYVMIKNIVYNLLQSKSPLADDMLSMINKTIGQIPDGKTKIISFIPQIPS